MLTHFCTLKSVQPARATASPAACIDILVYYGEAVARRAAHSRVCKNASAFFFIMPFFSPSISMSFWDQQITLTIPFTTTVKKGVSDESDGTTSSLTQSNKVNKKN